MKTSIHLLTLATVSAMILTGCASNEALRSVRSILVDRQISKPDKLAYSDRLSENMAGLGAGGGILSQVIAGGVSRGTAAGPRGNITTAMQSRNIAIEPIVADAYNAEIQRGGIFSPAVPGTSGDAVLKLEILAYGVEHQGDSWFSSAEAAVVATKARLMKSDRCVFEFICQAAANKNEWHRTDDFIANPELLRSGWKSAAENAAKMTMEKLAAKAGLARPVNQPAPAAVLAPPKP